MTTDTPEAAKPKLTRESYDENWNMKQTDTPRTDAEILRIWKGKIAVWVSVDFAKQLERELAHSLANQVKAQAEVKEIRAALGDDGRRTHKEFLELATKASQWREWKKKFTELINAHMAEAQDPAGTIWEHADKLQKELNASKAEVEELKQQKRNCIELIDDDAKERSELKAEVEMFRKDNAALTYIGANLESHNWNLKRELESTEEALQQMTEDAVNLKAEVERLSRLTEDCLNVIRVYCPTYYQDAMERFNKTNK